MAKYIRTVTKSTPEQIWLNLSDPNILLKYFTTNEVEDIITPYKNFVQSLPGYQSSVKNVINPLTMEIVTLFDTIENANNALTQLSRPFTPGTIQDKQFELVKSKKQELDLNYTVTHRVE